VKYSILKTIRECYTIIAKFGRPYPIGIDDLDKIEKDLNDGKF